MVLTFALTFAFALSAVSSGSVAAQTAPRPQRGGVPALPPPDRPVIINTDVVPEVRVVPIVSGLSHPWGMAFRDNGDILVTEREGRLRLIRNGQLVEEAIPGVPEVLATRDRDGLMDIALHPDDDRVVFLTYTKAIEFEGEPARTVALARGLLNGDELTEVTDIFVAVGLDDGIAAARLLFHPDGTLFMSLGGSYVFAQTGEYAQDPSTHFGKLLRLNDDGTPANGNPFVGNDDYLPEIYSMGHRNQLGLTLHPVTGDLWASENGPQGGDEVNIIRSGRNYGWPIASYSREYNGRPVSDTPWLAAFVQPEILWWPSIAPSGLTFYTGERFPAWQGNLFVGSLMVGRMFRTGHLERVVFNARGEEIGREWLLTELKQRIRDVRQGPDGYLYVLTEEDDAVLLRLEPVESN
jgi:glucose/arabinose dehydrogenase